MRIGIAGGGIAGLTLAWLIDGAHESTLLESRDDLGGNLRSQHFTDAKGRMRVIELGVHSVSLEGFPLFAHVTRALGLGDTHWITAPESYTIAHRGQQRPLFQGPLTPHDKEGETEAGPPTPEARQAISMLVSQAADWSSRDVARTVPLREIMEAWPIAPGTKKTLLYALPASIWGCTLTQASALSARAVAALFANGAPTDSMPTTQSLRHGMQELARRLAAQLKTADLRPGKAIRHIHRVGKALEMVDCCGTTYPVDAVVLAVPADAATMAIQELPDAAPAVQALSRYEYAHITQGVHLDPYYLCGERRHWSTTNIALDGTWALPTVMRRFDDGSEAFVSRLDHRDSLPHQLLAQSAFRTLLPYPAVFMAQRRLQDLQGHGGIYFAGHIMAHAATQESAVATVVDVARRLVPDSPRLAALTAS
ncbi:FAD-dependent oxidoreductase [Streptomyces sp. NPDC058961]|uniref:FAD-dependent oxidoreductase n=1 Tax=Streptomyces sp. NPDC058961 TaxID=3346680 RepID=UPI0036A1C57C